MTAETQTVPLLPCPFCGGEAWLNDYEAKHGGLSPRRRSPECRSCGVSRGYLPTANKAIAAWNRRPAPAPAGELRERVARIVDPEAFDHPTVHPQHLVRRRVEAKDKVDAILALIHSERVEDGGVRDTNPSNQSIKEIAAQLQQYASNAWKP